LIQIAKNLGGLIYGTQPARFGQLIISSNTSIERLQGYLIQAAKNLGGLT